MTHNHRGYDPCMDKRGATHVWLKGTEQSQWQETASRSLPPLASPWPSGLLQPLPDWEMQTHGCLSHLVWAILGADASEYACAITWIQILLMTKAAQAAGSRELEMSLKTPPTPYYLSFSGVAVLLEPCRHFNDFGLVTSSRLFWTRVENKSKYNPRS